LVRKAVIVLIADKEAETKLIISKIGKSPAVW
jgi:hypothetical protein